MWLEAEVESEGGAVDGGRALGGPDGRQQRLRVHGARVRWRWPRVPIDPSIDSAYIIMHLELNAPSGGVPHCDQGRRLRQGPQLTSLLCTYGVLAFLVAGSAVIVAMAAAGRGCAESQIATARVQGTSARES